MRLIARSCRYLIQHDACELAISWRIDVRALVDDDLLGAGPDSYLVGRLLADEVRRADSVEAGEDPYEVADADSSGLERAFRSLLDANGEFRDEEFDGDADPVVYLYRFALHPDFSEWRMSVLDAFCRLFDSQAVIMAQLHTTDLTQAEFEAVGFLPWVPVVVKPPVDVSDIYNRTEFMVRDNTGPLRLDLSKYPQDSPGASEEHAKWVRSKGPWKGLV